MHFKPTDFRKSLAGRRHLKDDAVPSIFQWSAASPKRKSPRKRSQPPCSAAEMPSFSSVSEADSDTSAPDEIDNLRGVGKKRRPKTQKRRPLQNRLEITLKWFERDYRPTQKRETTRFAFINKFDEGLRFVHNPTKSTKRRPPQNRLEITSKWFERDCRPKQKRETTRFAFINKFDQGLRFIHNPTKSTKRRPLQNRLDMS